MEITKLSSMFEVRRSHFGTAVFCHHFESDDIAYLSDVSSLMLAAGCSAINGSATETLRVDSPPPEAR
jgi:hypothetical protein